MQEVGSSSLPFPTRLRPQQSEGRSLPRRSYWSLRQCEAGLLQLLRTTPWQANEKWSVCHTERSRGACHGVVIGACEYGKPGFYNCCELRPGKPMKNYTYVYILQSKKHPQKHYTGMTGNLEDRLNPKKAVELRNTRKTRKGSNRISTYQPIRHSWSDHPMGESSNKMHHPQYSHIHWSFRAFRVFRSFPTAECRVKPCIKVDLPI